LVERLNPAWPDLKISISSPSTPSLLLAIFPGILKSSILLGRVEDFNFKVLSRQAFTPYMIR
jgi:hypothetical protein